MVLANEGFFSSRLVGTAVMCYIGLPLLSLCLLIGIPSLSG